VLCVSINLSTKILQTSFFLSFSETHTLTHIFFFSQLDIPGFNLNAPYSDSPPQSPAQTLSSTGADTSGPSSRRTSISSVGFSTHSGSGGGGGGGEGGMSASGSGSGRSAGSAASSRSTSFNLPDEARKGIRSSSRERGEEVEEDEEMDPEGMCCRWCPLYVLTFYFIFNLDSAAAKHAAFVRARGRHYSNEAEAMKVLNSPPFPPYLFLRSH